MKHTQTARTALKLAWRSIVLLALTCSLWGALMVRAGTPQVQEIEGTVDRVVDGDTLVFLPKEGRRFTIRLAGIDAPEKSMPYGNTAKQALIHFLGSGKIVAQMTKTDRYGRIIARILNQGSDVNLELVQAGLAWHYKQYAREQSPSDAQAYANAELDAKAKHVGLWQDSAPVPPWVYRKCRNFADCCAIGSK